MSLFSSMLQPILERELKSLEPEIASFLLNLLKKLSNEALEWAESKLNVDLNSDGVIGETRDEA
jgi:hypothetical protein